MPVSNNSFLRTLIRLAFVTLLFSSCKSNNDKTTINSLLGGLHNSEQVINKSNELSLYSLKNKLADPATSERASVWFPRALEIQALSSKIYDYIDSLKQKEKMTRKGSYELLDKLLKYDKDVKSIDPLIESISSIDIEIESLKAEKERYSRFYNRYFKNASALNTTAILSRIQNDKRLLENKVISFCNNQVGMVDGPGFYTAYSAILGQNSTILKPGEALVITAGLGEFTGKPKTRILIGGTAVPLNESGYAIYKVRVNKLGKHSIPVTISFFNPITSKEEEFSRNVQYTVAKPCDQ